MLAAIVRALRWLTLSYGIFGLGAGAFLESLGIPAASAVIDITAGFLIISGKTTFLEALIVSDVGLVLGSLASYYLGYFGSNFYYRYRHKAIKKSSKMRVWFQKYGDFSILFGQLFGPARTWISYPAGALGFNLVKFTIYTAMGGALYLTLAIFISLSLTKIIKKQLKLVLNYLHLPVLMGLVLGLLVIFFVSHYLLTKNSR